MIKYKPIMHKTMVRIKKNDKLIGGREFEYEDLKNVFTEVYYVLQNYNKNLARIPKADDHLLSYLMLLKENHTSSDKLQYPKLYIDSERYMAAEHEYYYQRYLKLKTTAGPTLSILEDDIFAASMNVYSSITMNFDNNMITTSGIYKAMSVKSYCDEKKIDYDNFNINHIPVTDIDMENFHFNELQDVLNLLNEGRGFRLKKSSRIIRLVPGKLVHV